MKLLAVGCGGGPIIVVSGHEVYESAWNKAVSDLTERAEFEMDCPADKLELVLVKASGPGRKYPSQVGVKGCEQRGMYVRLIHPNYVGEWKLNSATK